MMLKKIICVVSCLLCTGGSALAFDMDRIQIHGFVSQGYLKSDQYDYLNANTEDGTFEFNEYGINFTTSPIDRLRVGLQLLARDLGESGNDKVNIDWAFGDYRYRNWLGVRAGLLKRPMGLYNQSRDIDAARTGVFLPSSVYNENYRTATKSIKGVSLYGTVPGGFEYQAQYGTLDSEFTSEVLIGRNTVSAEVGNDAYTLHLLWNTPLDGLRLVGTRYNMSWTTTSIRDEIESTSTTEFPAWVVGAEYTWGDATVAAEYKESTLKSERFDLTSQYYYGLLAYRLTDWLELATSYSVTYLSKDDKEDRGPRGWSKDLALSTRFDINDSWIVKLEGHWMNGLYGVSNYGDDPDENGFLGAAKVTFSF